MKKKLNITIINRMMLTHFGGGENFDLNIAKEMRKRGHNVRILTGRSFIQKSLPPQDVYSFDMKAVPFIYVAHMSNKIGNANKVKWFLSSLSINLDYLSFELSAFKALRQDEWSDIYHICGLPRLASWLSKKLKKPVVVRWPGVPSRFARRYLNRYSLNLAGGDVYPRMKNWCKNLEYVEIGVDTEFFRPAGKEKPSREMKFLFVGRLVKIKNLPVLLKAFARVCKAHLNASLHIVGDGDERRKLEFLAQELGIRERIKFYGHVYKEKLLNVYQSSDVFVITSDYENFPNVILEAMACGLPVIATSVGGMTKQVRHGKTGFLVPPGNNKELAKAMEWFLQNPHMVVTFGKEARKFVVENFSWKRTGDQLEEIYGKLVESLQS